MFVYTVVRPPPTQKKKKRNILHGRKKRERFSMEDILREHGDANTSGWQGKSITYCYILLAFLSCSTVASWVAGNSKCSLD